MKLGRAIALTAIVVAAVAVVGGCQDYNFNPVGSCVIQPGATELKLADVTTADILFVVDDSGSMDSKQQALADNFDLFINDLNQANIDRVSKGLQPFDFHIAVTTSSIFSADPKSSQCIGSPGQTQCCTVGSCTGTASCTPGGDCGSGGKCTFALDTATNPASFAFQCCTTIGNCSAASCFPGDACPSYTTTYTSFNGCTQGVATANAPYPAGDLVAFPGNPKVLHFTKDLYEPTINNSAIAALTAQFKQNIKVGSCGSGEEQHLQAGRLAIQKVLAGKYGSDFPHQGAKLIVMWVGDEDDCSSSQDPSGSIVVAHGSRTGGDECVADKYLPANSSIPHRAFPVSDFTSFFTGLASGGTPSAQHPWTSLGTAFVVSSNKCTQANAPTPYAPADASYLQSPAVCTGTPQYACSVAYAGGVRFLQLAESLRTSQLDVIEGSVCEQFGPILVALADLVKEPSALHLPSVPASNQIALVRILDSSGRQRKVCTQSPPAPAASAGWWFVDCKDTTNPPAVAPGATGCIYINHESTTKDCEADPGETYSAEYLGQVPPGGCPGASPTPAASQACATALGGSGSNQNAADWWCYGSSGGTGTCVCNTQH